MAIRVRCISDPACVRPWVGGLASDALPVVFGDDLDCTFVVGPLGGG